MTNEPRKASEVLLEIEDAVNQAINLLKAQGFAIQLLSNKVTELMQAAGNQPAAPKVIVEAVNTLPKGSPIHSFKPSDPERQIPMMAAHNLPETSEPQGFRRSSRPETFAGDDVYLGQQVLPTGHHTPQAPPAQPQFPVQIPKGGPPPGRGGPDVLVNTKPAPQKAQQPQQPAAPQQQQPRLASVQNAVPVLQRVVNRDGKSVFLADVEVVDLGTAQQVTKTRTNGTGKWMASLAPGGYRVTIRKKGTSTSERMEAIQDIQVSGQESPFELNTIIVK